MLTLADINKTLHEQTEISNRTLMTSRQTNIAVEDVAKESKSIHTLIEEMVDMRRQEALDAVENRREGGSNPFLIPPPPGSVPSLSPPRPNGGEPTAPPGTLSGWENLANNVIGGMVGGGLVAKVLPKIKGTLGKGLGFAAIAVVAEMILESLPDGSNKEELTGDVHRAIGGTLIGALFGRSFVGALAGYFYEDVLGAVKKNDYGKQLSEWVDQYSSQVGIGGDKVVAGVVAGGTALAAVETGKALVKKGLATAVPVIAEKTAAAATLAKSSALNGIKSAGTMLWEGAKGGAKAAFSTAGAPLVGFTATMGLLGTSAMSYRELLEKYPELAPMNNGAGPGLQAGRWIVENNKIDEVVADQKARGLYKEKYVAPDIEDLKAPDMSSFLFTPTPSSSTMSTPKISPDQASVIESYLGLPERRSPTLVPPSVTSFSGDWIAGSNKESKPTVIVVPGPAAAPPSSAGASRSSTAIFTPPVATTDRLDGMDRISRPQ